MTKEGIIQKTIKTFIRNHNDPFMDKPFNQFSKEDLIELQQKLIREIEIEAEFSTSIKLSILIGNIE